MITMLPNDILFNNLLPFLGPYDLAKLGETCKSMKQFADSPAVWHSLYMRMFSNERPIETDNWMDSFFKRCNCKVWTWGKNDDSRLGYFMQNVPKEAASDTNRGVALPQPSSFQHMAISDLDSGGAFFACLTIDGRLWIVGHMDINRHWIRPYMFRAPRAVSYAEKVKLRCLSDQLAGPIPKITQMSCGRSHIIALDEIGRCIFFDQESVYPLDFGFQGILKVAAGWELNAAIVNGKGLVHWRNGNYKDGIVPSVTVPKTANTVDAQIGAGCDFLVMLDDDTIYFVDTREEDGNVLAAQVIGKGPYNKLRVNFNKFALVGPEESVFYEVKDGRAQLVDKVSEPKFVDIALGDYHRLGLTEEGEAFSWGCESQKCGSFGLGNGSAVEALGGVVQGNMFQDMVLKRPQRIPTLSNVVRIAAGGWQSAAVTVET